MNPYNELTQRLTKRLSIDRELRMEIARELEGHLEDAEAEFRRGGNSDQEAKANAIRALGDEQEISDGLWQANRRRMRLRSVLTWGARVTVVPLAILLMVLLMVCMMLTSSFVMNPYEIDPDQTGWIKQQYFEWLHADMSEDDLLIVYGEPTAESSAAAQRAIWERFPDEPMYYANFAAEALREAQHRKALSPETLIGNDSLEEILELGIKLDPDNAAYDYALASLYLNGTAEFVRDETLSSTRVHDGEMFTDHPVRMEVTDHEAVDRAAQLILEASTKTQTTFYGFEVEAKRQALLPEPRTMMGLVMRISRSVSVMLPGLGHQREAARLSQALAIKRARAGDREGAKVWIEVASQMSRQLAGGSKALIELLVAQSIHTTTLQTKVYVHDVLGDLDLLNMAQADVQRAQDRFQSLQDGSPDFYERQTRYGLLLGTMLPAIPSLTIDATPWRQIEYAVFDQATLMSILIAANTLVLGLSGLSVIRIWRTRGSGQDPMLLWIGWRRLGVVLGLGFLLPTVLVVLWWMTPWSSRAFGIQFAGGVLTTEYVLLASAVLLALSGLMIRAIYQRARELGIDVPTRLSLRPLMPATIMAASLFLTAIWSYLTWDPVSLLDGGPSYVRPLALKGLASLTLLLWLGGWLWRMLGVERRMVLIGLMLRLFGSALAGGVMGALGAILINDDSVPIGLLFACLGGALGILWVLVWLTSPKVDLGLFVGSAIRTAAPLAATGAVLLTLVVAPMLIWAESRLSRQIHQDGMLYAQEIEKSDYRYLREWLITGEVPDEFQ
ncbi:MAG: permease prefix domain 1-containing protein [Phycisphaeraceae bacterium]